MERMPIRPKRDGEPTTVDPRRVERAEAPPSTSAGAMRTAEATLILAREEYTRTVALMRMVAPIALVSLVALAIPPPEPPFRTPALVSFATTFVLSRSSGSGIGKLAVTVNPFHNLPRSLRELPCLEGVANLLPVWRPGLERGSDLVDEGTL